MFTLLLAFKSILNRKFTVMLTTLSVALSIMLLIGVERLRIEAHDSFTNTISGTDLIVGARSGSVQLLLYSVFRIGNATNNISWQTYEDIKKLKQVAWMIPLSLGDSHHGFRVLGTNQDYFTFYKYGNKRPLEFDQGKSFNDLYDAVIGADVAKDLHYDLGKEIVLSHGTGEVSFLQHSDKPFRVVGILKRTGTPVDRTIHVSLEAIEAIHIGWESGVPMPGEKVNADQTRKINLQPKTITAALVGLHSKVAAFRVQRYINEYPQEPLLAALPGVALQELWDTMAIAQKALLAISVLVVLVGITGMATAILTSLQERRREMAVLRSVGARPWHIFVLFVGESAAIMCLAAIMGLTLLYLVQWVAQPVIQSQLGLFIPIHLPSTHEMLLLGSAILAGLVVGMIPAYQAYRYSLADGMTIRV